MGLFDFMKKPDIKAGLEKYKTSPGAVLLDVRTLDEYAQGRIPGSINLDVKDEARVRTVLKDKSAPIFVYCHSGTRSAKAAAVLRGMGYSNVTNIGGIAAYKGRTER